MSKQLIEKITELKKRHNAVILAHNYEEGDVQDIADFAGDSLELSIKAAEAEAEVIVFCGVHFMAETAAVLNPDKTILLPAKRAGCAMADMATAAELQKLKQAHPEAKVICYVNSSAEVKAESDCCCTSANAVAIVKAYADAKEIIFLPDKNLGQHAAQLAGRDLILWDGYCPVHAHISKADIDSARQQHPNAVVMVHPECTEIVRAAADRIFSTGQMARFAQSSSAREFIVGTEIGILHRLNKENPGKTFHAARENAICPDMKQISLETILWSLEEMKYEVSLPPEIANRARNAIENMIHPERIAL